MRRTGKNNSRPKFSGIILAAGAYVTGVLLFSFWSHSAHQNTLLSQMDETLLNAAFSMQEIIGPDVVEGLLTSSLETISEKQRSLTRLARHGSFSTVSIVTVRDGKIIPLISGSLSEEMMTADAMSAPIFFPPGVKHELLTLATAGLDDSSLLTTTRPGDEKVRYAIRFHAEHPDSGVAFLVAQERRVIARALADQTLRLSAAGLGMLFLAIPLISLFSRTQKKTAEELSSMNARLQHDVELQQSREEELKDAISDLERFNAVSSGRETRIIELKAEVNELLLQLKRDKRYNIDKID
ncbi:hypothetical protein P4C99_10765 [Pontiellaceae bacterium B1224]|nr:hypothetical protein [Pontiellaceae bacterium B1224]